MRPECTLCFDTAELTPLPFSAFAEHSGVHVLGTALLVLVVNRASFGVLMFLLHSNVCAVLSGIFVLVSRCLCWTLFWFCPILCRAHQGA